MIKGTEMFLFFSRIAGFVKGRAQVENVIAGWLEGYNKSEL